MEQETPSKQRKPRGIARTILMGQRLYQQAERDLESASMVLQPRGYYVAANLAHESAEKALKAAHWHLRGEEAPWTHDLRALAERVSKSTAGIPPAVHAAIVLLEPLFERSRYPSGDVGDRIPADLVNEEDALASVKSAEEVMAWVRQLLQQPPGRSGQKRDS